MSTELARRVKEVTDSMMTTSGTRLINLALEREQGRHVDACVEQVQHLMQALARMRENIRLTEHAINIHERRLEAIENGDITLVRNVNPGLAAVIRYNEEELNKTV